MIRLREGEGWTGQRFLLCSLEIDSSKGRRINKKEETSKDTPRPPWQLTPEIEDDRIAESVKMAH